jgi:hypothetical protein
VAPLDPEKEETPSLAEIRLVDYASAKRLGYHYIE